MHLILIPTLEEREQEYPKHFEVEDEVDDGVEDGLNDWDKFEDRRNVLHILLQQ